MSGILVHPKKLYDAMASVESADKPVIPYKSLQETLRTQHSMEAMKRFPQATWLFEEWDDYTTEWACRLVETGASCILVYPETFDDPEEVYRDMARRLESTIPMMKTLFPIAFMCTEGVQNG